MFMQFPILQVRSTYKYTGEDVDELSFEIGDIIRVVEYDDPEEQVIKQKFNLPFI